jgi:hypothetical protein
MSPAPTPEAPSAEDQQILTFAPHFESACEQEVPPQDFARGLLEQIPAPLVGPLLAQLSPKQISEALRRSGRTSSPLVRADGQKWLAAVFAAATSIAGV